jgi:hypothetical protein
LEALIFDLLVFIIVKSCGIMVYMEGGGLIVNLDDWEIIKIECSKLDALIVVRRMLKA